jgi:two-component sensor histidine kinase
LELSAHGAVEGETLTQSGPELLISAKQTQGLSMAFHEHATNAVKHGALSADSGRIDLTWEIETSSDKNQLRIRWRETGVTIEREPARRGFGSDILEKSIPHILQRSFERTLHRDGIECLIVLPLGTGAQ